VYDYYTIFTSLFFQEENIPLEQVEQEVTRLLQECYDEIGEDSVYICLYGKAGLNIVL
jgi:hypothetical protein